MKKSLSLLLTVLLLCLCLAPVSGAGVFGTPKLTLADRRQTQGDDVFTFTFTCADALDYEENRTLLYAALRREFTDAEIALTDSAWVLYPVRILAEAVRGDTAVSVKTVSVADGEMTLSLTRDILPALRKYGAYTHESFLYTLRFSVVAETEDALAPMSGEVDFGPYACPETASIVYKAPVGTENPNTPFPYLPYGDLALASPTHPGATFGGWKTEDGAYIETIPANTMDLTLEAVFLPRTFRISYVLTTREGRFVYVNNQDNPRQYVYGDGPALYALNAPSGFVFAGWYLSPAFLGEPLMKIDEYAVGDLVLYARWMTTDEYEQELTRKAHWGDLDSDGKVTAADARTALRAAVGLETLPALIVRRADFDEKGHLAAADARTLLRVAVGLDSMPDVLRRYGRVE